MHGAEPGVTVHGSGEPEAAVVGGIHGDEPSGVRTVERLRAADPPLERGVKLVVADPPAVAAGERYLETDLNRSFPGDPDGSLEERLAVELCAETDGLPTLSLHATRSMPEPMALVEHGQPGVFELADSLPVPHVVEHGQVTEGSFTDCGTVVTVESGRQGTDAAAEAERQTRAFLAVTGALPDEDVPDADPDYYLLEDTVEKPSGSEYELLAENLQRVPAGELFARTGDDDLVAHATFYPVLMSECGYEDIFGYRASRPGDSPAAAPGVEQDGA